MTFLSNNKPSIFGFLFINQSSFCIPTVSPDAFRLFGELINKPGISFFLFQHIGPDFCHHTEIYTDAALELVSANILINTNISNN